MRKLAIIGIVGLPPSYGGFETLADNLVKKLGRQFEITVYCSAMAYSSRPATYENACLHYVPIKANGVQSIIYDAFCIIHAFRRNHTILMLGISGAWIIPIIKVISRCKVIVNVDGLEWKREKWGWVTKRVLQTLESIAARFADVVVADNIVIREYLFASYGTTATLIPYGGDHVGTSTPSSATLSQVPFAKNSYAFSICRIEPENNVHIILAAVAACPAIRLIFVGDWDVNEYSRELKLRFGAVTNILMLGPLYESPHIKNEIRAGCMMFLHGHSAGGTSPALVEAMYLGKPVLTYNVNYNFETTGGQALYFHDELSLAKLISETGPLALAKNAANMKAIANAKYTWQSVANNYASTL